MPELPEVETVRRGLLPIVGRTITDCDVRRRDVVRDRASGNPNPRRGPIDPRSLLVGSRITEIARKGKQLALIGTDRDGRARCVVVQLGMSGRVLLTDEPRIVPATHVHVVWKLDTGGRVAFRDARRFGGVVLHGPRESLQRAWSELGPDGLEIRAAELGAGLSGTTRSVKAALLDQKLIAGVGNIYADEALFEAGIHPRTRGCDLDHHQVRGLAGAIRAVLARAVDARGSTLRDYRDASDRSGSAQLLHRVYGRAGKACIVCGGAIESASLAQRTTCWCPVCQCMKNP
ncbi:MAG: bifunctional DNA-formamidopyrimidine glycosylase/DNA-(apurinic or apyrimidinic site) lyase [Phycisphaerales bacterium]